MKKTTVMGLEEKWEALIVYIFNILGFIFAFMKYDYLSENIKFHYRQAGALWIVSMGINIIGGVMDAVSGLPLSLATGVLSIVLFVFLIIAIVKAFEGEKYEIPVISNIANAIWKE